MPGSCSTQPPARPERRVSGFPIIIQGSGKGKIYGTPHYSPHVHAHPLRRRAALRAAAHTAHTAAAAFSALLGGRAFGRAAYLRRAAASRAALCRRRTVLWVS